MSCWGLRQTVVLEPMMPTVMAMPRVPVPVSVMSQKSQMTIKGQKSQKSQMTIKGQKSQKSQTHEIEEDIP